MPLDLSDSQAHLIIQLEALLSERTNADSDKARQIRQLNEEHAAELSKIRRSNNTSLKNEVLPSNTTSRSFIYSNFS